MTEKKSFLLKANEMADNQVSFSHPWNSNSLIVETQISRLTGLKRTAVSLAKIPPGKESLIYHLHHREEEWIYIISGKGIAEIDGQEYEVSTGDFMGFPTPSVAHHLRNPYDEDLVYLMGGENLDVEIVEFPHQQKLMLRRDKNIEIYNQSDSEEFNFVQNQ